MQPLTPAEIKTIAAKVGRPRANGGKIGLDVGQVHAMMLAGFSKSQIADYFDVSPSTVRRRLRGR